MEEDCQRALELFFPYGYGYCVFEHNICGNQLEGPDCTSDSLNFLSLQCFTGFGAHLSWNPLKMQLSGSIVEKWRRGLVEVPPLGTK